MAEDLHLLVETDHGWRHHCGLALTALVEGHSIPLAYLPQYRDRLCPGCQCWPQPAFLAPRPQTAQVLEGTDHREAHTRTALQAGNRTETEKCFMARVIAEAQNAGWICYHTFDSRRSQKGFPDLVLSKAGQPLILVELKSEKGRLTSEQAEWLTVLSSATGVETRCWKPSDWTAIVLRLAYNKQENTDDHS